jgi:hypothetical protein
MRDFQDYMNTPEIVGEPLFLREIHAARLKLQDETRGMSAPELADYYNRKAANFLNSSTPSVSIPAER